MVARMPAKLGAGGKALWRAIVDGWPDLDALQLVQLTEACRAKDRCDQLDRLLCGEVDVWARIARGETGDLSLKVDAALTQANATANLMKQLLAAMRLPDLVTGKRQAYTGGQGAPAAPVPGGAPTALERARARRAG